MAYTEPLSPRDRNYYAITAITAVTTVTRYICIIVIVLEDTYEMFCPVLLNVADRKLLDKINARKKEVSSETQSFSTLI